MRYLAPALLVVAITTVVVKLALAPFHQVYTAAECHAAYAKAGTHGDTVRIDFMPFDDRDNAVDTRCSTTRTVRVLSTADISPPR